MAHLSQQLAKYGRYNDHPSKGGMVAHISGKEASLLEQLGGAGTTNPVTGLKEFFDWPAAGDGSDETWNYGDTGDTPEEKYEQMVRDALSELPSASQLRNQMRQEEFFRLNAKEEVIHNDKANKLNMLRGDYNRLVARHGQEAVDKAVSEAMAGRSAGTNWDGSQKSWDQHLDDMWTVFSTDFITRNPGASAESLEQAWQTGLSNGGAFDGMGTMEGPYAATIQNQLNERQEFLQGYLQDYYPNRSLDQLNMQEMRDALSDPDIPTGYGQLSDMNFYPYDSLMSQALRGDFSNLGMQNVIEAAANIGLGPLGMGMTLTGLMQSLLGKEVVGTVTDPNTGLTYSVHEDGSMEFLSVEDAPEWDQIGYDAAGNFPDPSASALEQELLSAGQGVGGWDRQAALDKLVADTLASTANPGIDDSYFDNIIRQGIADRNLALGEEVSQRQFEGEFGSSLLGQELLGAESERVREKNIADINRVFEQQAFAPITDDQAIDNILNREREEAFGTVSQFGARGNLNPLGGQTANAFLTGQEPAARARLEQLGAGVREERQRTIDEIRDRAIGQAGAYNLGDELFDIGPVISERLTTAEQLTPTLQSDISQRLGAERLFDTQTALSQAAQKQGLVSGGSLLDVIAGREGAAGPREKRGLGTRGSGTF